LKIHLQWLNHSISKFPYLQQQEFSLDSPHLRLAEALVILLHQSQRLGQHGQPFRRLSHAAMQRNTLATLVEAHGRAPLQIFMKQARLA
jgi:hypothetical protein